MVRGTKHCWNLNDITDTIFIDHCGGKWVGKKSLLVICKVLRLFVNISIADEKRFIINRDNLREPIQMQLSQKQKLFSELVFAFLKSTLNFKHFQKKCDPQTWSISEITDSKCVVKQMSEKSRFRVPFNKQHCKGDKTLLKSGPHHLNHTWWSLLRQLRFKLSLLVICKILGLFVKTLNASLKYFLLNRENFEKPIQMILCQKQKLFSEIFSTILKSRTNFEHFPKKNDLHTWCIFESTFTKKLS